MLRPLLDPRNLAYDPDPRGALIARKAVARYYASKKIAVDTSDIFLTASTSEAYSLVFRLLCDPGARVAAPSPGYPLLSYLTGLSDVETVPYRLLYKEGWAIDPRSFDELPAVSAVLVVHPNNPTGNYVRAGERKRLNAFCARSGAALIADEVFHDFPLGSPAEPSFAGNAEALTFTLSGVSKVLALPQMKLSWIVLSGPAALKKEAARRLEVIADTFLSVNSPSQNALGAWLKGRAPLIRQIRGRTGSNFHTLARALKNTSARVLAADAGWYAVVLTGRGEGGESTARRLLLRQSLAVHPGYFYDLAEEDSLVLSLLAPEKPFAEGARRLALDLA